MPTALFGEHLPDQLHPIANTIACHLAIEADASTFLAERAALEREYASKLSVLTRKYREKKSKRDHEAAVGPSPTREWTGQQATLAAFVTDIFNTTDAASQDHLHLATELDKVSTEMASSGRKREEIRKKHTSYASKLLSDRDKIYADREKAKSKYDDHCREVEAHRQKKEKAGADDRHADRAEKGFQTAQVDMWNAKNMYLLQIEVSNAAKQKFYREDLPAVENRTAASLARANALVADHHNALSTKYKQLEESKKKVDPDQDQQTFIEYNKQSWQEPREWSFEPCSVFFDSPDMSVEAAPTVFLQNRLLRCRAKLAELDPLAEAKRKEVAGLENLRDAYEKQDGLGDPDAVLDNLFESLKTAFAFEIEICLLEAEVERIVGAIGENQGEAKPHRFKPASFTIPTTCQYCNGTIWGIARQGCICKPCGYTVHAKCEMKVPAQCKAAPSGSGASGTSYRSSSIRRSIGLGRTMSSASTGGASSMGAGSRSTGDFGTAKSIPESVVGANPVGRVVYGFDATSPFELSVQEGDIIELIEDDVESTGWIKVAKGQSQGLVPTSYCDFDSAPAPVSNDPVPSSGAVPAAGGQGTGQGCGKFVKALYDYAAQDGDELSLVAGEVVELTAVGLAYGDGWCQGVKNGKVGILPSNYVEEV
ncbi:related to BZZ1 - Myo3/5p-Bee1p-Vrp1p actin assembly complex component [Pseudozyma flocculosa]|uniref:Related to BZZ1 - Myo3/5p-Bee1p-Vrp1p actin assembly complex component n=1 Tax=Pseudozyma flocculosa TaxID=84751 RepID=A0A5C3F2K7_9BASI|nr:related to BZZ1 - Myo3/5p-Bee1p-Vrp1p actin assembly complex component [Pseudozyma flocculosa]